MLPCCLARVFARANALFAFEIRGAVDQGCSLEFVSVVIFFFGKVFQEVHVFASAYIDRTAGFSTEFVIMLI